MADSAPVVQSNNTSTERPKGERSNNPDRSNNPVSVRTFGQTLNWVTRASIRGLAGLVNKSPEEYPKEIVLDTQLQQDSNFPNIWVSPIQDNIGPLSVNPETGKTSLAKKNGFFRAIRQWRPTHEIGALNIQSKFKLRYVLDSENENKYKHTVLILTNDEDAHAPQQLLRKSVNKPRQNNQGRRPGPGPSREQPDRRVVKRGPPSADGPKRPANPNSWASRVKKQMEPKDGPVDKPAESAPSETKKNDEVIED